MSKRKELPIILPSIHTFSLTEKLRDPYLAKRVSHLMHAAVDAGLYTWSAKNTVVKRGGGMMLRLYIDAPYGTFVLIDKINLPRLSGNPSYLALTDLTPEGIAIQKTVLERELAHFGLSLKSDDVIFSMRRLDLTQDFYVKSDPSLVVRNLRFAGETGLVRGMHSNHFRHHNEKHSARWISRWYTVSVYDKRAEIKQRNDRYHNVPEEDFALAKNRLRYEVSLNRPFLRQFEKTVCRKMEDGRFDFNCGMQFYFEMVTPYLTTILKNVASDLFGEYCWQRVAYVQEELEFSHRVGIVDDREYSVVSRYLTNLNDNQTSDPYVLTPSAEKIIRSVLDRMQVNRIVIPDRILNQRELKRFPCFPLHHYVSGDGEKLDILNVPRTPWQKHQKVAHP